MLIAAAAATAATAAAATAACYSLAQLFDTAGLGLIALTTDWLAGAKDVEIMMMMMMMMILMMLMI